jgi:4-amino-4-deoxy-L-arabinose transferase-like glycosyltransferase
MSPKEKTVYDAFKEAFTLKSLRERLLGDSSHPATRAPRLVAHRAATVSTAAIGGWQTTAFWLVIIAVIAVRLWLLDSLQAEVYGDISTVHKYVLDVKNGVWPFYFALSAGPLYHYLIMPVIWLAGLSYMGLKLASVVVSLGALAFTYLFARRLLGARFAILATFIAGISYWLLIFSRLGNFPIIVPLLVVAAMWLLLRFVQERNRWDLYACAVVCALGLLAYPQAYFLAPAVVLTLLALYVTGFRMSGKEWLAFFAIFVVGALPFVAMVIQAPGVFTDGYLGEKIQTEGSVLGTLFGNIFRAFGAYHFSGDPVFRSNPAGRAHIDLLSGILFLIGIVYWLQSPRRKAGLLLLVPFVVLHIPSILVISGSGEVPSATRTLGVAPIAYLLVASGLWATFDYIQARWNSRAAWAVSGIALLLLTGANLRAYFVDYANGLPYGNTPIARMITDYADTLPAETQVYLTDCCWESGMPEPLSIQFEMAHPENLHLVNAEDLSCSTVNELYGPAVIIWSFRDLLPSPGLAGCAERFPVQLFSGKAGLPAFNAASIQGQLQTRPVEVEEQPIENVETLNAEGLLEQELPWGDEIVIARYSLLDIGRIEDVVDGNFDTLMRGRSDNPLIMEFEFEEERALTSVTLTTATIQHFTVRVLLTYADGSTAEVIEDYENLAPDPTVEIALPEADELVKVIRIEVNDLGIEPEIGFHIHVRDVKLR